MIVSFENSTPSDEQKAAAKQFHTELVRKNHPDLHPEQSDFFTKELQKVNAHWDDFRQSHAFEKLASFFNKKAMDKIPGINFNNKRTQIVAAFEEQLRKDLC